jgi:DNA-binding NarL/FixJ family response regulator
VAPTPIRIVLGDGSYLLREGVTRIVADTPDLELVGECGDLEALRALVNELRPDVVLTDIRMPPTYTDEGVELAVELRETHPQIGVVVLSHDVSASSAELLLGDGAARRGYVLKDRITDGHILAGIVRVVAAGGSHLDPHVVEAVFAGRERAEDTPIGSLTPRELEVLALVAEGDTNAVIAEKLGIGVRAVERHVNSIFEKLELRDPERVSRRVKAALAYVEST